MSSQCTMVIGAVLASLLAGACSTAPIQRPSSGHIRTESLPPPVQNVPKPVQQTAALPKPKPTPRVETYSVVVNNVRVQELLFALARDAKLNVDIHSGISGTVTLNAIDQTLPQLLNRIAKQVDMRFELDGPNLVVMPDTPFLRTYRVDYVNMTRDMTGTLSVSHQITGGAGTGASTTSGTGGSTAGACQVSTLQVAGPRARMFATCRFPYSPDTIARIRIASASRPQKWGQVYPGLRVNARTKVTW